jgi:hypothetical protein
MGSISDDLPTFLELPPSVFSRIQMTPESSSHLVLLLAFPIPSPFGFLSTVCAVPYARFPKEIQRWRALMVMRRKEKLEARTTSLLRKPTILSHRTARSPIPDVRLRPHWHNTDIYERVELPEPR